MLLTLISAFGVKSKIVHSHMNNYINDALHAICSEAANYCFWHYSVNSLLNKQLVTRPNDADTSAITWLCIAQVANITRSAAAVLQFTQAGADLSAMVYCCDCYMLWKAAIRDG